MGSVFVTRAAAFPPDQMTRLRSQQRVTSWDVNEVIPRSSLLGAVREAEGLLCLLTEDIDRELLDAAPRLRVISQMAVGVDNIDLAECTRRQIPVGHTPGVLTETTADTAMALLLAVTRRLPEGAAYVREGRWAHWEPNLLLGGDLSGSTVGIVGLGRIGQAVARRCTGFGCRLLYTGPHRKPVVESELRIAYRSLPDLLSQADHVILTASLGRSTQHLVDARALRLMKPDATLVNIARGPLIDHDALAEALAEGIIARAGLDVTEPEPLPVGHALLKMSNCLVIPHLGSASVRTRHAMASLAVSNLLEAMAGRPMPACANPLEIADTA
jgi:lactate dehydrogenase-like 2-hydroxyacid dehydrogenase